MKIEFSLHFEKGMPSGTAQMKGERIRYKFDPETKKTVPYIDHYIRPEVQYLSNQFKYMMKKYRPEHPSEKPIRLTIVFCFDIKRPKKLWGTYKTTRPDIENFYKQIADLMTDLGFWKDDSQIVDLRLTKYYAEQATIHILMEEIEDEPAGKRTTEKNGTEVLDPGR